MLGHGPLAGKSGRDLHGRQELHDVFLQGGIPQGYQTEYDGTGRIDDGLGNAHGLEVVSRVGRYQLGGLGHLEHVVKSNVLEPLENVVHVSQILKLSVQSRRGKRDLVRLLQHVLQAAVVGLLGLTGADLDADAAVDTASRIDLGVAVHDADGLGGAMLQAGRTSRTARQVQRYRMFIRVHSTRVSFPGCVASGGDTVPKWGDDSNTLFDHRQVSNLVLITVR